MIQSIGTVPAAATPNSLVIADGATFGNNIPAVVGTPGSFTVNAKRGLAVGGGANGGATINVVKNGATNNVVTYGGIIADIAGQTGVVNKSGDGELDLNGPNTFSGGLNVNGGAVKLSNLTAAGSGPVAVNNGGTLSLGSGIGNAITLNSGGFLGVIGNQTISGPLTISGTPGFARLDTFDPIANATNADMILTGMLKGNGNVIVQNMQGISPDGTGLRLRGPVSSGVNAFSGTITLDNSSKLELQTNGQTTGSQAGTGTIKMTAGDFDGAQVGTFAVMNLRNNSSAAVTLGNNVQILGSSGFALVTLVAPTAGAITAGTPVNMGSLTMSNQGLGVGATNGTIPQALTFTNVILGGTLANFDPTPPTENGYNTVETLSLGVIDDSTSVNPGGSSISMVGNGNLVLTGVNTYRGSTTIGTGTSTGTANLTVSGALPSTTALIVNSGTLSMNNGGLSNNQSVVSLSGTGGTISSTDLGTPHTLTVNQSTTTTFAGSPSGNLTLIKTGNGTLNLTGPTNITGALAVNGGTVAIATGTVGTTSTATGGILAVHGAANIPAALTVLNGLNLSDVTSSLAMVFTGTTPGVRGTAGQFSQIFVNTGTISLGGNLTITPIGYAPTSAGDTFDVIVNSTGSPVAGTFANADFDPTADDTPEITVGDVQYDISYASGPSGHDVTLTVVAVPEPGSLAAVISGFGMLLGLQRFRRRS